MNNSLRLCALFSLGVAALTACGSSGDDTGTPPTATTTVTRTASPRPTATVTKTSTPAPAPTVTVTETDTIDTSALDDSNGSDDVYYANCAEVRAAGAAPIHRGEPGYASRLDRDGDGTGCDS